MKKIDVTAAIIFNNNKILIAQRKKDDHLGGKWEFPGGKIEHGETPEQCLRRELKEEFDIDAKIDEFVDESIYDYGDRTIRLLVYKARYMRGEFKLHVHDQIKWVSKDELKNYDIASADIKIVNTLLKLK